MKTMKQKLIIELSEQATQKYLEWLKPKYEASAASNCIFPGFYLELSILPSIEELIYGKEQDGSLTELGEVNLKMIESNMA